MQVSINLRELGLGSLWNRLTGKHCSLGLVCKAAGIEDEEMNAGKSVVFFRQPDEKDKLGRVTKEFPVRDFPSELTPFFSKNTKWDPMSIRYLNSSSFVATELGQEVITINDQRREGWQDKLMEALAKGGVELIWEENSEI